MIIVICLLAGFTIRNNYLQNEELRKETLKKDIPYNKQVNAIACILLADKLVSEIIFKDKSITLEEAKEYFAKDTDEAERCINLIIDIANANINNFFRDDFVPKAQVWGKLDTTSTTNLNNDGTETVIPGAIEYYYFIPSKLEEILKSYNINWNSIKKILAEKEYISTTKKTKKSSRSNQVRQSIEYTVNTKINGTQQRVVKIKNIYN